MIGTNDAMVVGDARLFREQLTRIVLTLLDGAVLPVLSTMPDSHFQLGRKQRVLMSFNQVIADVADRFAVPLWNAWAALHRLPNHGLQPDGVHLNASPAGAGRFWPSDLIHAQNLRNLQALTILDWFRESVARGVEYVRPSKDWRPLDSVRPVYAVGRDAGFSPTVDVYDGTTGSLLNRFLAFRRGFGGGVRVATGDANGDGFTDVVCAANGAGIVKVISGVDGASLARLTDLGPRPASIAVGDLDGDGAAEIVVARGGRNPSVRVYGGGSYALRTEYNPFGRAAGETVVAVANIEGTGPVVIVAGGRAGPTVRYFDPAGYLLDEFETFSSSGAGISLAAADLDRDGFDEVAVGRAGAEATVRVLDGATHEVLAEFALGPVIDPAFGVRLGSLRRPDGTDELLVGSTPGSAVSVRGFDDLTGVPESLPIDRPSRAFGIFVG